MVNRTKGLKVYSIITTLLSLFLLTALFAVVHHAEYDTRIMVKLGLKEDINKPSEAVLAWDNCLQKLDYKADIVFWGDSITAGSDFRSSFPDKKIVNLGYGGDSLAGMRNRVSMVKAMSPEKVFIMGGINSLTDYNINECVDTYESLLDDLHMALPNAEIYVQSVLPVSFARESILKTPCHNSSIEDFNMSIKKLAEKNGDTFIDLHSLYVYDGQMNPSLTLDGIHLCPEAYNLWSEAIKRYIY